jgi:hypothetical protein
MGLTCNDVAFQNKKELFEQAIFAFAEERTTSSETEQLVKSLVVGDR